MGSVYALHPSQSSALLSSPLYKSGNIILQDLASCFPAEILVQWYAARLVASSSEEMRKVHAIDATAAPGNKTSHLSTLLYELCERKEEQGQQEHTTTVTAFERDPARFRTLKMLLGKCGALAEDSTASKGASSGKGKRKADHSEEGGDGGAHNVTCVRADFLSTDPEPSNDNEEEEQPWADVKLMMLDPSCSGSGILGRLDHLSRPDSDEADELDPSSSTATTLEQRLASLASFQLSMIAHAMRFPALEAFTYSTCSIHAEENEEVVRKALELDVAKERGWKLASREQMLSGWKGRGWSVEGLSGGQEEGMIRADAGGGEHVRQAAAQRDGEGGVHVDATNGFFVCLFERVVEGQGEENGGKKKRKKKKKKRKVKEQEARQAESDDGSEAADDD